MLNGIDISHHNSTQISTGVLDISKPDFVIMKATEGKTYNDPKLALYLAKLDTERQGVGFYHYARPEINPPHVEALHFLDRVGEFAGKALYALDVEGKSFSVGDRTLSTWVLEWCRYVQDETGVLPLVYTGTEGLMRIGSAILRDDIGLWFARYRSKLDNEMYAPYKYWAIWQFTSNPWDMDKFNGNRSQWAKYCAKRKRR